jgi:tetrahydromethanopterin S-methyltransferase subunit B
MLSGGLILHNWTHGNYTNFASGFLIGISLVFLIASVLSRSRSLR